MSSDYYGNHDHEKSNFTHPSTSISVVHMGFSNSRRPSHNPSHVEPQENLGATKVIVALIVIVVLIFLFYTLYQFKL